VFSKKAGTEKDKMDGINQKKGGWGGGRILSVIPEGIGEGKTADTKKKER